MLVISGGLRLWHLGHPRDFIFDEIYYAKDAHAIILGQLKAVPGPYPWEPGKEISWPHPEWGKLAIAGGIEIFGYNPFGRRIAAAVAGFALLALVYPLAQRFGLSPRWALAALMLAAADPLGLTQSRIATLDIFVALWSVACIYLVLRYTQDGHRARWLWAAGVAGGLAFGTKWSGAPACFAALALVVLAAWQRRRSRPRLGVDVGEAVIAGETETIVAGGAAMEMSARESEAVVAGEGEAAVAGLGEAVVAGRSAMEMSAGEGEAAIAGESEAAVAGRPAADPFARVAGRLVRRAAPPLAALLLLPAALYVASYFLYFAAGHTWSQWWELQRQMWTFNLTLKAKHTYASSADTWIVIGRPVWYYFQSRAGKFYGIVAIGNPLLWWASILALAALPVVALRRRQWMPLLPSLMVAVLYLPWFGASRTSFLYYMTPVAPFLALAVAAALAVLAGEFAGGAEAPPARAGWTPQSRFNRAMLTPLGLTVLAAVLTVVYWHELAVFAAQLFWHWPAHVAPALAWVTAVLGIGAAVTAITTASVSSHRAAIWRRLAWVYVGVVVGVGVIMLPVIIDIGISPMHYYQLMWFPRWI